MENIPSNDANVLVERPPDSGRRVGQKPLIRLFNLIVNLLKRNFAIRYRGSAIGIAWSIMLPLAQLFVLVITFTRVVPLNVEAYPVFVFSALTPWVWFSSCMGSAGGLFVANRDLLRRPNFWMPTLVISDVLANLVQYLLFMPIVLLALILYDKALTVNLLFLPVLLLILGLLITGLSLIVATLNVFYRDIQHIVSVVVMLMFYVTPVFYEASSLPDNIRTVYNLNPLAFVIQAHRTVLLYGRPPEWIAVLLFLCVGMAVCGIGYACYHRFREEIYDFI